MRSPRGFEINRVGLAASVVGWLSVLGLSFGRVRPFRLATGAPVSLFDALPLGLAVLPVALWLLIGILSVTASRRSGAALARGVLAGAVVVTLLGLSGFAAVRQLEGGATFARYSIGGGVWVSVFCALTVILDSRRRAGMGTWRSALIVWLAPVGVLALMLTGRFSALGMAAEYRNVSDEFWIWAGQHVLYAVASMAVALAVGIALGIGAYENPRMAKPVFVTTGIVQTIPGLAMIGVLAVPLGLASRSTIARALGIGVLGWAPVVIALTLYALLVLVRNTYAGLSAVPAATIEAGRGMGMTRDQLLRKVELPLASPIIFSGTRTAFQQTIGNATLAYFVAAGSLGRPIFSGVSQQANDLVLLGSVALVALAIFVDIALRGAERLVVPRRAGGLR